LAAWLAPQVLVSSSQMRLVMMLGLSASCWLAAIWASLDWKVNSSAGRPPRPPVNWMVGSHEPKSAAPPALSALPLSALSLSALPLSLLLSLPLLSLPLLPLPLLPLPLLPLPLLPLPLLPLPLLPLPLLPLPASAP
jgi:hypothetical protein